MYGVGWGGGGGGGGRGGEQRPARVVGRDGGGPQVVQNEGHILRMCMWSAFGRTRGGYDKLKSNGRTHALGFGELAVPHDESGYLVDDFFGPVL